MQVDKTTLRNNIRQKRKKLSFYFRKIISHKITELFCNSDYFQQNNNIACYLAVNGEVDTQLILQRILLAKKNCYLPCLHENEKQLLLFRKYQNNAALIPNKYNILEPNAQAEEIAAKNLDVVIIPLVGFDHQGNRLGMGKGYYDRTFAFKQRHKKPFLVGFAYELQCIPHLIPEEWDIPLDVVVTEKKILKF